VLIDGLTLRGWEVRVVDAYRTVPAEVPAALVDELVGADAVVFASSSAVANFAAAVPPAARVDLAVCIGPITAATARHAGFAEVVEAEEHTVDGLCDAVRRRLGT
jgi:uroporphyrinogen-III synthase